MFLDQFGDSGGVVVEKKQKQVNIVEPYLAAPMRTVSSGFIILQVQFTNHFLSDLFVESLDIYVH